MKYTVPACSGRGFGVKTGQTITVTDMEGGQVADFFAVSTENPDEFLSAAVTIDCNESLRIKAGSLIYTNLYHPMFEVLIDDVGRHDLLFPSCRPEMYDFFYGNGEGHSNCFDNINNALGEKRTIINPLNIFMNTHVEEDGKVVIGPPVSKAGDKIVLKALMDVNAAVSACSVSESATNSGHCTAIGVSVDDILFRTADADEVSRIFELVESRVRWMDTAGIRQWNATNYLEAYPVEYYADQQKAGNLYVLEINNRIAGAVVILEADERWEDRSGSDAFYVHNLATSPAVKGAGKMMLKEIECLAADRGKEYVRLDCASDNDFLNSYYGAMGYEPAGQCSEGLYIGNRREKTLPCVHEN